MGKQTHKLLDTDEATNKHKYTNPPPPPKKSGPTHFFLDFITYEQTKTSSELYVNNA